MIITIDYGHFNTSNVTIQPILNIIICLFNLISIHLMLLFNFLDGTSYNSQTNFNTSNVTIQLDNLQEEMKLE